MSMNKTPMERNLNLDFIKTISIFGVVYIHTCNFFISSKILIIFSELFRIAVPCFIIIWSYFTCKNYYGKSVEEFKRVQQSKFFYFLRVYAIWSLIYFLITVDWDIITLKDLLTKHLAGYGWSGQYFFIILFQLIIIYPLILRSYNDKFWSSIILISIFAAYILWGYFYELIPDFFYKLGVRPFLFWIPYMMLGMDLYKKNRFQELPKIFILSPLLIALEFLILKNSGIEHNPYLTIGVLTSSCLFFLAIRKVNLYNTPKWLKKIIVFIGSNTLTIFVSNPIMILILKWFHNNVDNHSVVLYYPFLATIILTILVLAMTMLFAKAIDFFRIKKFLV